MGENTEGSPRCTAALDAANMPRQSAIQKAQCAFENFVQQQDKPEYLSYRQQPKRASKSETLVATAKQAFQNRAKTSPSPPPCRRNSRLRMAALSKTKKQLFTGPRSSTQMARMFDAEKSTVSTTAFAPLVSLWINQDLFSGRYVLSAPPNNLVDLLAEGAAFGKSRLSAGGLAQNCRARAAHHNGLPKTRADETRCKGGGREVEA